MLACTGLAFCLLKSLSRIPFTPCARTAGTVRANFTRKKLTMASFNKVVLMGNVTRDPQVRYTTGGTAVTDVGLAVNRQWTDRSTNERKEEVSFIDVTLWGKTAEIAGEYLSKGRPCLIEGRLQMDSWQDRETGQKRSKLKVVGESMQLLGGDRKTRKADDEPLPVNNSTADSYATSDSF